MRAVQQLYHKWKWHAPVSNAEVVGNSSPFNLCLFHVEREMFSIMPVTPLGRFASSECWDLSLWEDSRQRTFHSFFWHTANANSPTIIEVIRYPKNGHSYPVVDMTGGKQDNWTVWGLWRNLTGKRMLWVMLREMNDLGLGNWENTHSSCIKFSFQKVAFVVICSYLACLFDQKLLRL